MRAKRPAVMAALVLPSFLYGFYRFSVGVLVPSLEGVYSVGDATAGGVVSASVGLVGLGVIGSGYLAQKFGDLKVILAGFLIFSLSMGATTLTRGLLPFSVFFLLASFGSGLCITPSYGVASSFFPERKGFAASFVTSFYSFAGFVGPSSTGFLLTNYGWHAPFVGYLVISLAFFACFLAAFGTGGRSSSSGALRTFGRLLRMKAVLVLAVAAFFADLGFLVYLSWTPKFLVTSFGASASPTTIDTLFGVGLGFGGAGTLTGGFLFDKIGGRKSAVIGAVLPALAMLGVYLATSFGLAVVFALLTGALANMFWALITAMSQVSVEKDGRAAATSLVQTSGFVGAFIGPGLAGLLGGPVSSVLILTSVVPYVMLGVVVVSLYHDPARKQTG